LFAKLALAVLVVPGVCGHILALVLEVESDGARSSIIAFAEALEDVPSVGVLAVLVKEQAAFLVEGPVLAGWAVLGDGDPVALGNVEPFINVVCNFIGRWVVALAAAGVFIPVLSEASGSGTAFLRSAQAGASACVPVETSWAFVFVPASAFARTSVPVLEFRASLLFALAAAVVGVPVEALSAVVRQAAALAALTILVLEPEVASSAVLRSAFPSAGTGVPVLASSGDTSLRVAWEAEALAAFVVPVLERSTSIGTGGLDADALAVSVIPEFVGSAILGIAHAVAVGFAPVETSSALLGSASATALSNVEDLLVTANLGSASAASDGHVVEVVGVCAVANERLALAGSGAPVVVITGSRAVWQGVSADASAFIATPDGVTSAGLFVADAVSNLEVPEHSIIAVLGLLDARAVTLSVGVPDEADCASLRLLFAAAADGVVELAVGAQVRWTADARAGREVPDLVIKAGLRSAGALAAGSVPVLISSAAFGVWVADAAALFNTPESFNGLSAGVGHEGIALASGFKTVALAAHVVENVVFGADLGGAAASASIGVDGLSEVAGVPVLVRTALLGRAAAEAVASVEVVASGAVSVEDSASAIGRAVVELLGFGVETRARVCRFLHAVPFAGHLVPAVRRVLSVGGTLVRVADARAGIAAPVVVSGAVVIGEALATAIIIIKIIICSASVSDTLAPTINVIPDVCFRALARKEAADAVVTVGRGIVGLGGRHADQSGAVEEFVLLTVGVWSVGPAR
jgi:hypothetical protein